MRTGHDPGTYEIRVQGRLGARWARWFDGFALIPEQDGTTVLAGTVVDQAALHGLLQSLNDLGLPLLSVTRTPDVTSASPDGGAPDAGGTRPAVPAQDQPRPEPDA